MLTAEEIEEIRGSKNRYYNLVNTAQKKHPELESQIRGVIKQALKKLGVGRLMGLVLEDVIISSEETSIKIVSAKTGAAYHSVNWTELLDQVEPELMALVNPS